MCPYWAQLVSISNKFKVIKAPVPLQSRFTNDLSTAITSDTACCCSFLLDSQGEFLYSLSLKKQVFINATVEKGIEAMKLGTTDFLEKPADIKTLTEKIKNAHASKMILVEKQTEEKIKSILAVKGW